VVTFNEVDTFIRFKAADFSPDSGLSGFNITTSTRCHWRDDVDHRPGRDFPADSYKPFRFASRLISSSLMVLCRCFLLYPRLKLSTQCRASSRSVMLDDGHVGTRGLRQLQASILRLVTHRDYLILFFSCQFIGRNGTHY